MAIISVEIAIVDNECFCDMNDALMKMFSKVNKCMIALKKIVEIFSGKACIDISFCQYGTYPAMVVSKEIIKKIDFLEADLSIDPYWFIGLILKAHSGFPNPDFNHFSPIGTSVSYKYNSDGLRSYKKVGETVSEYEYLGDKLVYEKRGSTQFHYRYDASGTLASIKRVKASGSSYTVYVICNSRGDIDELRNENGSLYARYVYDTWGNTSLPMVVSFILP